MVDRALLRYSLARCVASSPCRRAIWTAFAVLPLLTADELANNTFLTDTTRRFNRIPSRLLNPIAQNILTKYYPQSNPATPFSATKPRLRSITSSRAT